MIRDKQGSTPDKKCSLFKLPSLFDLSSAVNDALEPTSAEIVEGELRYHPMCGFGWRECCIFRKMLTKVDTTKRASNIVMLWMFSNILSYLFAGFTVIIHKWIIFMLWILCYFILWGLCHSVYNHNIVLLSGIQYAHLKLFQSQYLDGNKGELWKPQYTLGTLLSIRHYQPPIYAGLSVNSFIVFFLSNVLLYTNEKYMFKIILQYILNGIIHVCISNVLVPQKASILSFQLDLIQLFLFISISHYITKLIFFSFSHFFNNKWSNIFLQIFKEEK